MATKLSMGAIPPAEPMEEIAVSESIKEEKLIKGIKEEKENDELAKQLLLVQRQQISMMIERELVRANVIKCAMRGQETYATAENRKKQLELAKEQMDIVAKETHQLKKELGKIVGEPTMFHQSVQTEQEIQSSEEIEQRSDTKNETQDQTVSSIVESILSKDISKYTLYAAGALSLGVVVYKWFF